MLNNDKNKSNDSQLSEPDSLRTTHTDIDFQNTKDDKSKTSNSGSCSDSLVKDYPLLDCKVVLDHVFSSSSTEKFKTLKLNPEKTHSVSSHQALEKHYLENLSMKFIYLFIYLLFLYT